MATPIELVFSGTQVRMASAFQPMAGRDPSGNVAPLAVDSAGNLKTVGGSGAVPGIGVPAHDAASWTLHGATNNINVITYRTGGPTGTVVGTLTLVYSPQPPTANDAQVVGYTRS